jgi:very-short-patch-repair endonuclease
MPTPIEQRIEEWKERLIDLTRRNRLLYFQPTKASTLKISVPDVETIFQRIYVEEKCWRFWLPPKSEADTQEETNEWPEFTNDTRFNITEIEPTEPNENELVCEGIGRKQLERVLKTIYRRARTDYQERGIIILHMTFGMLSWREGEEGEFDKTPLVLCPVKLTKETASEPYKLSWAEEDIVVNPALITKLQQSFNIQLPTPPENWENRSLTGSDAGLRRSGSDAPPENRENGSLTDYLLEVAEIVRGLGWEVQHDVYLGFFTFHKLAMYKDLVTNAERIKSSAIVKGLAGESLIENDAGAIPDLTELDHAQKPQDTFQILDADSSQQQCIQAALAKRNIVLQGPPGTGKSQTIANIIAEFIARGSSVLFVSEKMAALEVVFKRLRDVKLDEYCLELHSHKANKREVITTLGKSLRERLNPTRLPSLEEFAKFEQSRAKLNEYVKSLHEIRQPLGKSVFEVISLLTQYKELPTVGCHIKDINTITPTYLIDMEDTVREIAAVWHVTIAGENFIWFDCKEERFNAESRAAWTQRLQNSISTIKDIEVEAQAYANELGLQEITNLVECEWLINVGKHLNTSPSPDPSWLTSPELNVVFQEAQTYQNLCNDYWFERNDLANNYSEGFFFLPSQTGINLSNLWERLISDDGLIDTQDNGDQLAEARHSLLAFLYKTSELIRDLSHDLARLTDAFELRGENISPQRARGVARLALLCTDDAKPVAEWLDALRLQQVCETVSRLKPQYEAYNHKKDEYNERRKKICERYDESLFELELSDLIQRFSSFMYRSPLRYILPAFYRDKKAILRCSRQPMLSPTTLEDLLEAREIVRLQNQLKAKLPLPCKVFGGYDRSADTDFRKIEKALENASMLLSIVSNYATMPNGIIKHLTLGSLPNAELREIGERILQRLDEWEDLQKSFEHLIPFRRLPQTQHPFSNSSLIAIGQWTQNLIPLLAEFTKRLDTLLPFCTTNNQVNLNLLISDLGRKDKLENLKAGIDAESERLREKFGLRYQGLNTTWSDVLNAIQWTSEMRRLFDGREITSRFVEIATNSGAQTPQVSELANKLEIVLNSLREVESNFYSQTIKLDGKLLREHDFQRVIKHLKEKQNRIDELQDWIDYKRISNKIKETWLEHFTRELKRLNAQESQLVSICRKSIHEAWASYWKENDSRLESFRAKAHEEVITDFRELDSKLIQLTAQRIIKECESRRPQNFQIQAQDSEVSILRSEALKKKRHLPVRILFNKIPNLLLNLKPCLLMSPLSVSQFLQSERLKFDLVIFDEASQIFTEDAIGAISRGSQLIVAGDSKQLPPTDFFKSISDSDYEDDDYELDENPTIRAGNFASVLDECQAISGITVQHLRWHYRSRHESLIAFSNHRFYSDKPLVTFPAARDKDETLGVKFVYVEDGIYDRGGKRHNLREAQRVADLVFEHFRKYPKKSIGVVAFSQAQMMCIEDEIEKRRMQQQGFEDFFKDDRLEGFFVKNLENVQGDERDVIIFSVGYGKDRGGQMTMGFGPLNRSGGERRLNVAVTRAREKVLLVSSIKAGDLRITETTPSGVLHLHRYLDYAERGVDALYLTHPQGMGEAESRLEEDIASEIRQLGYDVVTQVGCSGYRIDIGVINPSQPGNFLLGVEADGATYHSAYTARERDRLRQQVLEKLGWRIHRIWSFDWFHHRAREIENCARL